MRTLPILSSLATVILFASCSSVNPRYISSPSAHNAAFVRERGDYKFSVAGAINPTAVFNSGSTDNKDGDLNPQHSAGMDGQAAVAVTDHFLIAVGANYRSEKDKFKDDDMATTASSGKQIVSYERRMVDIGLGFYTAMSDSRKAFFNLVGGVGIGSMSSNDIADPQSTRPGRYYNAGLTKYYLNPSFNLFFNDYLRMSVAPRISVLNLHNINTNYTDPEETKLGYKVARNTSFGVFEPSILLQSGFRNNDWLKLDFGFNFASNPFTLKSGDDSSSPNVDTYNVKSRHFLFSLGLSFYPFKAMK